MPEADEPGKPLAASAARNDADVDLRLSELRVFRRDADVARHRELASAAKAVAVDHRDQGLRKSVYDVVERGVAICIPLVNRFLPRELVDVRARDERLVADARDQRHSDGVVLLELPEDLSDLILEFSIHRVELLGAIQSDDSDRALPLQDDCL